MVVASDNGTDGNNNEYKSDLTSSHLAAGTYYLVYRYTYGACTVYGGNNNNIWANSGDYESVTVNALPTVGITVSETVVIATMMGQFVLVLVLLMVPALAATVGIIVLRMGYRLRQTVQQHIRLRVQMEMDVQIRRHRQ